MAHAKGELALIDKPIPQGRQMALSESVSPSTIGLKSLSGPVLVMTVIP
jgi:hypothetical protein